MKKITSLIAVIALMLLASCGKQTEISTVEVNPEISTTEEVTTEETVEVTTEESVETNEPTEAASTETTVEADSVVMPPVAPIEEEIEITTSDK